MPEKIQDYKDLVVWQKAMLLVKKVYLLTESLPQKEQYGICNQIRRAAVSIPSNIAEGKYRSTAKDFCQFLRIAHGSTAELETQLFLIKDIYQITSPEVESLLVEVRKMLMSLINKLS